MGTSAQRRIAGIDEDGREYASREEFWQRELADEGKSGGKPSWYLKAVEYWDSLEATDDAVMGGYSHMSGVDARDSCAFLRRSLRALGRSSAGGLVALDCGAGVGRVTEETLLNFFSEIDLVEPAGRLLEEAKRRLRDGESQKARRHAEQGRRAVHFFEKGLEEFCPTPGRYDAIWIQWCIGHLADDDLLAFFERCKAGLKEKGRIYLKENTSYHGFVVDRQDTSITRSHDYFKDLFSKSGLSVERSSLQRGFPVDLFPVRLYELRAV